jgi:hypothetical protein
MFESVLQCCQSLCLQPVAAPPSVSALPLPVRPSVRPAQWLHHSGWDCGFESRREHTCLSVVSVVNCQIEVSATGRSLVQSSSTECVCVCVCVCHLV